MSSGLHARWYASVVAGMVGLVAFGVAAATLCGPSPPSTSLCEWFIWGDRVPPPAATTMLTQIPLRAGHGDGICGVIALCHLRCAPAGARCLPVRMIRLSTGGMAVSLQDARTTASAVRPPEVPDDVPLIAARITGWFGAGEERVLAECYLPVPTEAPDEVRLSYRIEVAPDGDHLRYCVRLGSLSAQGGQRYNPTDENWEPLLASVEEVVLTVAAVEGAERTGYAAATIACDGQPVDLSGVLARSGGWQVTGDGGRLSCQATSTDRRTETLP